MKNKSTIILAFLAAICFFICYFFKGRDVLYLILGITWAIIGCGYCVNNKKDDNEKDK